MTRELTSLIYGTASTSGRHRGANQGSKWPGLAQMRSQSGFTFWSYSESRAASRAGNSDKTDEGGAAIVGAPDQDPDRVRDMWFARRRAGKRSMMRTMRDYSLISVTMAVSLAFAVSDQSLIGSPQNTLLNRSYNLNFSYNYF